MHEERASNLKEEYAKLDSVKACSKCHGAGIEEVTYNFQLRVLNCSSCDGEGFIGRREESRDNSKNDICSTLFNKY